MRILKAKALALCLLVSLAPFAACDKKAASVQRATADVVTALHTALDISKLSHSSGYLDKGEYAAVLDGIATVSTALREFNVRVSQLKTITPENKEELLAALQDVVASLNKLQQDGVLRIKNDAARSQFETAIIGARTAISVVSAYIAALKKPVPVSKVALWDGHSLEVAAAEKCALVNCRRIDASLFTNGYGIYANNVQE
ncbi:MAG TPA: hypothetical protein VD948_12965 [Rhodothermales bacterium]|nr:hypothetical protein [Rhodothermales bacterium]